MAVIQDPQGAFFEVWEPKRHIGAGLVNASGALLWNELASNDLYGSRAFYAGLFGWTIEQFPGSEQVYLAIRNGEASNGGMREATPPGVPPHWLAYFGVENLGAALEQVSALGGTVHAGPIDIQMAKIAMVADPQGAVFALYDGMLEP
jgi:predicted enzyme related to lactoylglutathione lyase